VTSAALLTDSAADLEAFDAVLSEHLPAHLYDSVAAWVNTAGPELTGPLWDAVGRRCQRLEQLAVQAEGNETAEQGQQRIQQYFESVNPGPIARELQSAAALPSLTDHYRRSIGALAADPAVGPLVTRYLLPDEVLRALAAACVEPLRPCMEALGVHAQQMKTHADLLKSLQETKGLKTGVGVAATVAGGLLLGPLGAIAARALTGAAMDPSEKINQSAGRVGDTFEGFRSAFVAGMERVDANVADVYASIYGGLVLRLQADLAALGRGLTWIDFQEPRVLIGLSPAEVERFTGWAQDTVLQLEKLRATGDWLRLGDGADKALRLTTEDPLRANVVGDDGETSFAVLFARFRAVAMNAVADAAWEQGRVDDACQLYKHLLEGTNLAWEPNAEAPDEALSPARAGWRLAVAATSGEEVDADQLLVFPEYVAQAMARFQSEQPFVGAPGEMLSGTSVLVSAAIESFGVEALGHGASQSRTPEHLRSGGLGDYGELLAEPTDFDSLNTVVDASWAGDKGGALIDWFSGGVQAAERTATRLGCAVFLVIGLVLLGVGWLVYSLVT